MREMMAAAIMDIIEATLRQRTVPGYQSKMPRLSTRQRILRQLSEVVDTFFLLEMLDANDDSDILELFMLLQVCYGNQRYIERPIHYSMKAEARAARIEFVLNYDDRHFAQEARMSKTCFWRVVDELKDNPVFSNESHRNEDTPHHQLLITLFRLGKYGNGAGIGHTASYLCSGTERRRYTPGAASKRYTTCGRSTSAGQVLSNVPRSPPASRTITSSGIASA